MNVTTRDWRGWYHLRVGEERFRCWLNGVELDNAIAADEERGYVIVIRKDASGRILLNQEKDGVRTKTLRGAVHLERVIL